MVYNNILEAIGNTPIIKLQNIVPENCADILVKFEGLNVGGSIKTRTAYNMIKEAEKQGADAIVCLRYGSSTVAPNASEILAYGTAVKLK